MNRLALFVVLLTACGSPPPPAPTVATASSIRGAFDLERGGVTVPVGKDTRAEEESNAITGDDGRGSLRLDNGSFVLLDRGTSAKLTLGAIALERGRAWIDASRGQPTTLTVAGATIVASEATLSVALTQTGADVYCGAGEITYRTGSGEGRVAQGETLRIATGAAPELAPAAMWDDWTGGLADPTPESSGGPTYVGQLLGRRLEELGQARTALPVRGHEVRTAIRDDLAETEVTQTFFNARSDVLEAEYALRVPEDAIVQRFEVDLGGGFVTAQAMPFATQGGYALAWQEPAFATLSHLAYDGPGRLRARVFPVAAGATVRVRIAYTQWLARHGNVRTYVYPMESGPGAPLIGELTLEVDTSSTKVGAFRAGMGATVDNGKVTLRVSDFRPQADFYLDLVDGEEKPEESAVAYVVSAPSADGAGNEDYVMLDVPPTGSWGTDEQEGGPLPLSLVVLLDTSGGTDPEDLELARSVLEGVLRQLAPTDKVAIRLADVSARVPEGAPPGLAAATDETREAILEAVARAPLSGATDLGESFRQAAQVVAGEPLGTVLYLGDGLPTTGALDATAIRRELETLEAPPRFFALAVGDGANLDLLRAVCRGSATAVRVRTDAARAVMDVLADAARPTRRGVRLELGEGVERVYPRFPLTLPEGDNIRVVGRLRDELPKEIVVRGTRNGAAFETTIPLRRGSIDDRGDVRKRWATARLAELLDEDAGREALVELGVRFGLVTPWTSLVVGGTPATPFAPVRGFDLDPTQVAWSMGGGGAEIRSGTLDGGEGWRRRAPQIVSEPTSAAEETWPSRVNANAGADAAAGDGGLATVAVGRALERGGRGPRGCYERRLIVRPDLRGDVAVRVGVDGTGNVLTTGIAYSTLSDPEVEECILIEVRGLRFPATGSSGTTEVTHVFVFAVPDRPIGVRSQCSDASRQALDVRRNLWRERLAANGGVEGALSVYRDAMDHCELGNWRARRTLLDMMLDHLGHVGAMVQLFRSFGADSTVGTYLRAAILRRVRTPDDVRIVREGLGLEVPLDWGVFTRLWNASTDPNARLALVRRWLEVVPDEMDLRLRLLSLLEQTNHVPEAKRIARELRADPIADARVRTAVGEFWLRQSDEAEARRTFSEIVELAPLDPWARKRLGDLYRAHGWFDDAYREYGTLARLRPDPSVLLSLAAAAAGAGRVDEALRLEQRLSEASDVDGDDADASTFARLWTTVRLAGLQLAATDGPTRDALKRRARSAGTLREPPALFVALTWTHPDDGPQLSIRYPSTEEAIGWERAPLAGAAFGIEAIKVREREEGDYLFRVERSERDDLRPTDAELLVIVGLGTETETILRAAVHLTREAREARFRLVGGALRPEPVPPPARGSTPTQRPTP